MTYRELKAYARKYLSDIECVENPEFEARTLLCHITSFSPQALLANRCEEAPGEVKERLDCALERRKSWEPLQYIIGQWDFFGMNFFCGKGCLIPRPETELLAEKTAELAPKGTKFLDLCTGSGCIAISALAKRADLTAVALDKSKEALSYAKKNAAYHGVEDRLSIVCSPLEEYVTEEKFHIIVSNPPYVKSEDVRRFDPQMKYEPGIAFDGGEDGLDLYRIIAKKYKSCLTPEGYLLLEAGFDTVHPLCALLEKEGYSCNILADCFGVERFCIARKKQEQI